MMDFKGAIFDVDGVLLDSMSIWEDLGVRYIKSFGLVPEEGLSKKLFAMSMEQGTSYLAANYPLGKSEDEILNDLHVTLRDYYYYEVEAKRGAAEFVKLLKEQGIKITVATSSPRSHVTEALKRVGIFDSFDAVFTTSEIGESKHSPLIYNTAAASMGLDATDVVVIEDSKYAAKTAADAGFKTIGVFDASGEKDQEGLKATTDIYVKDLLEAKQMFTKE